ncbi:GcpE protein [Candidatus Protochlamydia naegleriophila]|uniref:4-hydroxy-3-methylbut-2-en-1-yl diphosphate synthase (flavodoxin) n=1 Tax=Candidatus Protochlamydia naegleriophila TaxID=389348 RepID=A0A0U5ES44_9BACT|nr:(E)-4-hydroxy-3-methylbut-2-enyl-diphosphate synthase [Candidatus Protochlamydia naegleriophila]CUI16992.1 GcpE protein [Candidatus Protochlamydia naegleriophila]
MNKKYCEAIYQTQRRPTRTVMVGHIGVGGNNPVRIQSMTTSNTRDVEATIDQVIRLADNGCEIVRMTVQGIKEADACEYIKNGLVQRGYNIPLVADIHFYPPAAMRVIDFVDKVRINPGNFVDKRASFKQIDYDDESYSKELERIEEKFTPLVEKCKQLKRAMRIGTNHGSLSDRIMNRYGDTPFGMVESALEFARICRKNDYHDFLFSMKASNPQVMIQAYRLLTQEMYDLGWDYPLHLGVTEAGEGEDGRVKSAMGIGSLLLDGIGDTIRVSLTEDPWLEIDPCQRLIKLGREYQDQGIAPFTETHRKIECLERRPVDLSARVPMHRDGTVFVTLPPQMLHNPFLYQQLGCEGSFGRPKLKTVTADNLVLKEFGFNQAAMQRLQPLKDIGVGLFSTHSEAPAITIASLQEAAQKVKTDAFASRFSVHSFPEQPLVVQVKEEVPAAWQGLLDVKPDLILLAPTTNRLHYCRQFFEWVRENQLACPVILNFAYSGDKEDVTLLASMECGALLCDGLGEGLWLEGPYEIDFLRQLSFSILQAARMRMSKTDFISCPSCGRTLFNLQDVTKRIQARTSHLPGVKIAIMGCIVNGPGEMADADFGYVGSKPGMIDLYVGKECVERNIDFADADDRLIELIKTHGRWVEPSQDEVSAIEVLS